MLLLLSWRHSSLIGSTFICPHAKKHLLAERVKEKELSLCFAGSSYDPFSGVVGFLKWTNVPLPWLCRPPTATEMASCLPQPPHPTPTWWIIHLSLCNEISKL